MDHRRLVRQVRRRVSIHKLLHHLSRLRINIIPYYVVLECTTPRGSRDTPDPLPDLETGFLPHEHLAEVVELENGVGLDELEQRINRGHLCFVVKHEGRVVAKMWCDLSEFHFPPSRFDLREDEAYLYAAHTHPRYQGMGIAPLLREKCYEALSQKGITRFYSYTEFFNKAAQRFKKKVGARNLALKLHVSLPGRFSRNWTIKRYPPNGPSPSVNGL